MGSIEKEIIELAKQGFGRPTILEKLSGRATDWQIRTVLSKIRVNNDDLTEEDKKRILKNVRPSHFDVVTSLRPTEIHVPRNRKILPKNRKGKKVIFIGDTHAPFEDKAAISVACQIISNESPDILVHLGDLVDFYSISKYEKDPTRRILLQDELEAGAKILGQLDQTIPSTTRKILVRGNHEHRLEKYIHTHAPAFSGLPQLKLDSLLGLKSLGWEYIDHDLELFDGFLIKHGEVVRSQSAYSARSEMEKTWMSGISGHTHRLALFNYSPRSVFLHKKQAAFWIENGALCGMSPDWVDGTHNWQHGFTILHVYDDMIVPELVHITRGAAVYRGKLYRG